MWDKDQLRAMHWDKPDEKIIAKEKSFVRGEYDAGAFRLPYRLFVPMVKVKVPMIIYLHGADDRWDDNTYHITHHENACIFAIDEWQVRHPCYILAPHCPEKKFWEQDDMKPALKGLFDEVLKKYGFADPRRVLIFGNSMGGVGTLAMVKEYPSYFSRALSICGATVNMGLEAFDDIPLCLVHAEDDKIVKPGKYYSLTGQELLGSFALYDQLRANGKKDIYLKKYPAGSLMKEFDIHPHCSWYPALRDDELKRKFFGKDGTREDKKSITEI